MEGDECAEREVPKARIETLVNTISQYKDVYPVLQRGVQFLGQELCDGGDDDEHCKEVTRFVEYFVKAGSLTDTVSAMLANLDSPAFISSCFELLIAMINNAEELMTFALEKSEIFVVLDKIVHNVMYQNESACVQRGIRILAKVVANLRSIENRVWAHLVATTAQAMLTNSPDNGVALECVISLKLLFRMKKDVTIPPTSANVILKTLDQFYRHPTGLNNLFVKAAVEVVIRISSAVLGAPRTPQLGLSASVLAAGLHHYQLKMDLEDIHKHYVEKLIQEPFQAAIQNSLTRLISLALPSTEMHTEAEMMQIQNAAMTLLLTVVWRDEARAFLHSGGVAVLANVLTSEAVLAKTTIELALAQALYYVSMHWPDETWSEVISTGIGKWIEVIETRWEGESDGLVQYLLASMKTLLYCEGFCKAFTSNSGINVFQLVLVKHHLLPISARLVINVLISMPGVCPTNSLPDLISLVADTMFALDAHRASQLDCVTALTLLTAQQRDKPAVLSSQQVREIVRVMRSKLLDCPFIIEMINLVSNTLLDSGTRASFIDRGILQVVSRAICIYQWNLTEPAGSRARLIICDVAHKLDVSRNLSILEPQAHISNGHSFNTQAISTESLDACCSVVGALALVKPLLPQLIAEGSIQCMVGMLRYAKQELIIRNEDSFVQLVMTCFFGLGNIVSAPTLIQIMGPAAITSADEVIYGQVIYSQLLDVGADDAVIGCLEQSLRVKKSPPLLVDSGCRLLQAILAFPITLTSEAESRWIAVATSILQRTSTNPRTRELLFATTLMFLSRCNRSVEPARGQHIKMMKVILECLDSSIQHERSCTLLQAECTGAIRVLEEIAKSSDNLSDALVSKCLGVLGKLIGIYMLSSSTTAQENLAYFDSAVALFATTDYVNRLISRLERCMTKEGRAEPAKLVDTAEDFKALRTLLFSAQAKKTIDAYHRLFSYLAAMVDNVGANVQTLGEYGPFFLELGCLTSQLLPTAQREEVINTALCQYAEDTAWHSMRWIAALADRGSSEFTLIVEFVLLRIVSGYTILEPALLMELLDALNYLLRCNQCREIVLASSHARELQYVLWQLVRTDVANMESESDGYDIAVSLLGITSILLSSFSEELFSIHTEERGSDILVRFCLGALDSFLSDASAGLTKLALLEEVFQTTSIILQHCIRIGADHVRSIIQHRATQHVVNLSVVTNSKSCQLWYLEVLGVTIQSHGLLYAEKLLLLSSDPYMLLISLVRRVVQDRTATTWDFLIDCLGIVTGTMDTSGWRSDCNVLFVRLQQQSKRLVNGQTTVANARRVRKHITDTSAQLQLKHGQLIADSSAGDIGNCLKEISESGLAFYELFNAAPSFNAIEYSMIISLHLKIAQLACLKTDTERTIVEESAGCIRQLLAPICILDDAMADYINLAVTVYLSPSIRAAAWLFIDASTSVLSKAMHRLTTGVARPQCLEKSIANCFASLQAVYNARWESGEVDSALELLKICSIDKWSQDLLLESLLVLPQGLLHLFKLARAAPSNSIYRVTMNFLFQHVSEIRHKTQRVGELELSAILSVINRNPAGKVGDICQRKWGQVPGSEMLRSALETLKLFARRKNCAVLSADLGGIDTLYNVLCAPSQYEDNTHLALEISCYLAGYGANTAHESLIFVFELLFSFVENSANYPRSRLAFLVLEFFLAVDPSLLNMSLVQQCRTQIVPSSTRSYEESKMFVQQLYIVRQKLVPPASRLNIFTDSDISDKTLQLHVPLRESEILDIIISQCRRIVQVTNDVNLCTYVDVNTSEKSTVEPQSYSQLKEAISQLSFVLDDPDMVANERFVSDLVPALCEILVLHTITTTMICTTMRALDQITFVKPSIVLSNERLDRSALFASLSLHHRSSLQFTQYLSRFCNNVSAECRTSVETRLDLLEVLIPLLFEVLQNWKTDFGIVDQSISSVHYLTERICNVQLHFFRRNDTLAYLNAAALPYISHCPTSWNWIKATLAIVSQFDMMTPESVQAAANTTIAIIRMFMSHSFMVKKALMLISLIYREKALLALPHLLESDGITMLLTTLKLHANEPSIARNSLMLLVSLSFQRDTSRKTMDQLLAAASTVPILLVCKKYPNDAQVCEICVKLIHQMVQLFNNISNKKDQLSVVPGSTARKKSELLANLLEADIISFLFDLLDSYSSRGNNRLLEELLALLKTLTKDEHLRESAEVLHGLQELQQVINRIWGNAFDSNLIEMAIDCFVNLACSDQAIGHGWRELPMWLLELAGSIHKLGAGTNGMCVEKLIGILGRLAIDSAISKAISPKGSFIILQLLLRVKEDRLLEQAIYGLLCTLCESVACAQVLIVYDTVSTIAERITCHMDDEDTLLSSLCFFDVLVLNIGESYPALQDECIFEALNLVIQEYPESTGSQIYRIASTTLEKVTALDFRSVRIRPAHVQTTNSLTPQLQIPDAEKPFHDLLTQGAKFRVLWEARPDTVESIQVKLAPGGDYLLFRRKTANSLPRIERVFASQLEVCPQRSLSDECKASASPSSPSNRILAQSLLREKFDGDRVLRLKIRDEDVLVKASSTRERIYWDLALQWLVSRRQARTSPTHSPIHSP